jgi:5-methyltetrahydrofolate--homocysteine methyltransferase
MTDMGEMEIAVRAAAQTGLPVVASMTYEKNPVGYRTVMGHSPEDSVKAAVAAGAAVVGANCGSGVDTYVELASVLRGLTDLPIWIKANAGLPELIEGRTVYRMDPETYASHVPKLLDAGVNIIGGCCGTSPEFIRTIAPLLKDRAFP